MAEALLATLAFGALAIALAGYIAQRLRLPPLFGYLAVGVLLSQTVDTHALFPLGALETASEAGVLLILFLIGAELDIQRLRETVRRTAVVLPFDVLLPMVAAGGVARLIGWSFEQAVALGAAVALSSTLVGERVTAGAPARVRQRVLGTLVSEDVAAGGLLALLAIVASGQASASEGLNIVWEVGRLLFLLILLTAGALLVVPRILDEAARRHVHELLVLWGLAIVAFWAYLGGLAGSAELGAFVAGVAAAEAGAQYVTRNAMLGLRDAAIAVFFFTSGLVADVAPVLQTWWIPLLVAGVFLVAKILVHVPGGIAGGLDATDALRNAFALGTLGEFSLIMVAVAAREGIAHPALQATIVGAMLILLPVSSILLSLAPRLAAGVRRLPRRIRRPLEWLRNGLQGLGKGPHADASRRRDALQKLGANVVLLVAFAAVTAWAAPQVAERVTAFERSLVLAATWGMALAVSTPLWWGAFRGYRDLVWIMVGLRPGERVGAGRVRTLLVDAVVSMTAVLVLGLVSLRVPATVPVMAVAAAIAASVAFLAWRRLTRFHRTLEDTVTRVLGRDENTSRMLDGLLQRYPWGVHSAAVIVPSDSPVARRTVESVRIGELTGAMIVLLQRGHKETVNPPSSTLILPGDTLVLMGDPHQLARAEALIVSHGEAMRMTAQTRQAIVEEVELAAHSRWIGATLQEADLRHATGCLVAGVWPAGSAHPLPYQPSRVLRAGDRLVLLGTRLQLDRAMAIAAPAEPEGPRPGANAEAS